MATGTYVLGPGDTVGSQHLDLLDGVNFGMQPGGPDLSTEGKVVFDLHIYGESAVVVAVKRQALKLLLNAATSWSKNPLANQWVTFQEQRDGVAVRFYDVLGGTIRMKRRYQTGGVAQFTVTLDVLPSERRPPVTLTTTAEMTNGSILIEVPDIPGDVDALVRLDIEDTSTSGVINQIRGARRSGDGITTSDWNPITDLSANGGTLQGDAASVGGSFMQRTGLTGAWLDVAMANGPSGLYHVGEFDIFARLKASASALAQPGTFSVTKTDPVVVSVDTTEEQEVWTAATFTNFISARNVAVGTANPTVSPSWPGATQATASLVAIVNGDIGGAAGSGLTIPAGWTLLTAVAGDNPEWIYIKPSAASESGAKTWTWGVSSSTGSKPALAVLMFEARGASEIDLIEFLTGTASSALPEISGESTIRPKTAIVGVFAQRPTSAHTTASVWFEGATERLDTNDFNVASIVVDEAGAATRFKAILTAPQTVNAYLFGFRGTFVLQDVVLSTEETTTTWGDLAAGSRQPTVYPVDAGGGVGPGRTASSAMVTTVDGCKLVWGPAAVAGASYYISQWTFDGHTYRLYSQTPTFTLTSEADAVLADDLPAIVPNTKVGNYARLVYGQQTGDVDDGELVYVPEDNAFRWHQVAMATLPPVGALIEGDVANWRAGIQFLSGGSESPVGAADALWIVPHNEPSFVAMYPSQNLATKRHWVIESTRRGNRMQGWLRDGSNIARGGIDIIGGMTLAPGDNLLALLAESASGVAGMGNHKVTMTITYWSRWTWSAVSGA